PAAILLFRKQKPDRTILFIDASREFEDAKGQNRLRDKDIDKIVATYKARQTVEKYSYVASYEDIKENEFNLNIPRYVDTFEEEEPIDVQQVQNEIIAIDAALARSQKEME